MKKTILVCGKLEKACTTEKWQEELDGGYFHTAYAFLNGKKTDIFFGLFYMPMKKDGNFKDFIDSVRTKVSKLVGVKFVLKVF